VDGALAVFLGHAIVSLKSHDVQMVRAAALAMSVTTWFDRGNGCGQQLEDNPVVPEQAPSTPSAWTSPVVSEGQAQRHDDGYGTRQQREKMP
jgi:hypothetical protein